MTDKYHFLGKGAFGDVYKGFALERNYETVAIKKISLQAFKSGASKELQKSIDKEIDAFCRLKDKMIHPNILAIYDVLKTPNNLYIVMEYSRHGDVADLLAKKKKKGLKMTENEAIDLLT